MPYTSNGPRRGGRLGLGGGTVQGPLPPSAFSPFVPYLDFGALQRVLYMAAGLDSSGMFGTETPQLPDGTTITPGASTVPTTGGYATSSSDYLRFIAAVWGSDVWTPEMGRALVGYYYPGETSWNAATAPPKQPPGGNGWWQGAKIGTVQFSPEGGAGPTVTSVQTDSGSIPVEGWAGEVYCGDVIAAADLGQQPGPFPGIDCQHVISLAEAQAGGAGGVVLVGPEVTTVGTGGGYSPEDFAPIPPDMTIGGEGAFAAELPSTNGGPPLPGRMAAGAEPEGGAVPLSPAGIATPITGGDVAGGLGIGMLGGLALLWLLAGRRGR